MIEFKKRTFEWLYPCLVAFVIIVVSILVFFLSAKAVTLLMVPQGGTGAGTFTAGGILQGDGTGAIQSNIMSGDGTLSASGVLTVSADAIETITVEGKAAEDIDIGEAVYISGAVGNNVQFSLADNTVDGKTYVAGVAIESKTAGQTIRIRHVGQLDNFNTSAWADGDNLYLSTAGSLINTIPTSGTTLHVAYVEYSHATLGDILLHVCGERNIGAPASTDLFVRMGDNAGTNKLIYRDYANNEIANIDSDGNAYFGGSVGIGIATPAQLFHMQGNGTAAQGWARFGLSSTEYTEIGHKGNNSAINAVGDGNLDFRHDSVTKMSLTDAGVLTATTFTGALSGNATTATALAANGANCAIGNYPLGVNASGAVESCTPIGGGGDITDVFDCSTGDCNTVALGTGEWLVYGNGFIDANRFGGVVTVSGTEFSYLNNVTSAIQTQFSNKQPLEATLTDIADGTIAENLVNTANPWADNEVSDTLTCSDLVSAMPVVDMSTETNLTAGRSLTMSADSVVADSELYHHEKCLYFEDPTADDDFKSLFHFRKAATITSMWCESDQTVNMDLQLDDGTPADINGTDLVCDSTPADDTSMGGDTGAAAGERLDLAITSVSGTPTWVSICFDFTYDD